MGGKGSGPRPSEMICSLAECNEVAEARGYCRKHYRRWYRHGNPETVLIVKTPPGIAGKWLQHHTSFVGDDCLPWPFNKSDGRGQFWRDGSPVLAARVMCEMAHGPAPTDKHHAAHSCGKAHEACVNPNHLGWKTPKENEADKILHGTRAEGERHGMAKLTAADIPLIRAATGTLYEIGDRFGIDYTTAGKIRQRKLWDHIP